MLVITAGTAVAAALLAIRAFASLRFYRSTLYCVMRVGRLNHIQLSCLTRGGIFLGQKDLAR